MAVAKMVICGRTWLCAALLLTWTLELLHAEEPVPYSADDIAVMAGQHVTLVCGSVGAGSVPVRTLQWFADDRLVVEFDRGRTVVWLGDHERIKVQPVTFALLFKGVVSRDTAHYACVADGETKAKARLIVRDVPDPPGKPLIQGFTSRSVNLSWAPSKHSHNSPVDHYIIRVRVGENGEWDTINAIMTRNNATQYQVIGLQPYTVYSFQVLAANGVGVSAAGRESYYMVTLREVPDGKPNILSAHNTSESAILITWAPPDKSTIHGEFLGYRISFRPRELSEDAAKEIVISESTATSHLLKNLETFTQYLISLQVFNPEGNGPASTVVAMTDEGLPSKPQNVTVLRVTDSMLKLEWTQPEKPNGVIQGYRLYFQHRNYTDIRTIRNPLPKMEYLLTDLEPYTEYTIWIRALTWKLEGDPSEHVLVKTDVQGPSAPYIVNLTCRTQDTLFLQWERPHLFYHQIDYYYIYYRSQAAWEFEELTVESLNNPLDQTILIPNLTANSLYEVKVRGGTRSLVDQTKVYRGQFSEPRKVLLHSKCHMSGVTGASQSDDNIGAGVIAGVICVSFAFLLAILAFVLWRKYFQASYYYLDDPAPPRRQPVNMAVNELYDESDYQSIPVHLWAKHVANLHADGDIGFSKEYEAIQQATAIDYQSDQSQVIENKIKNRYLNIVAYDHSRVTMRQLPGQKKCSDYINANYIDGYNKPRAYIGTQGPLPSTFPDFWRMVWEQRVVIIVMITNLVERGRRKCDMYWPKEGTEMHGFIQVKFVAETVMATYTIRTFSIRNTKVKKKHQSERMVYQYHYTNWPDHGVPEHPLPVLSFIRKSSAANPDHAGPIIVHCSAGVGRTGTYIVLDAMLHQIKYKLDVNVFGFLKHIRQQRNYLVQTEEQYIFLHDALLEAIEAGETDVGSSYLSYYIQGLQTSDCGNTEPNVLAVGGSGEKSSWQLLERQFKLVTSFVPKDFHLASARKTCNTPKNRCTDILPIEAYRVHITPKPGTEGSDYINATFLQGFSKLKEFIITQHPLQEYLADFWQMVWDHNSQTIVMLSYIDEKDYEKFWPAEDDVFDFETFKVKASGETCHPNYTTRDFLLQSTQDDYELVCRILHMAHWPECCSPLSSVFDLLHLVQQWHVEYQNGPLVVVDKFGGTEAATFCCLMLLHKLRDFDDYVDVYQYAKLYHMRRPGIWKSQDDYLFLYRAMESICSTVKPAPSPSALPPPVVIPNVNGHVINGNGHIPNTLIVATNGNGTIVTNKADATIVEVTA